ncbi:ribosomal RNA processing protein 1B-like [Dorcoceras hygrometricum]|nr:ribosomal RNA processing protein 1B-like [Dorcoceras hygrometricum]
MKKRSREAKPILPALASASGPALIKYLASCNTTVRSQSLRLIQSWLASQPNQLSESDIKKLWKGLFYCVWHADKTPNQVALIDRLTSLFLSLQPSFSLDFFRGFLLTLRREWSGIDRLRLDKFYLLIRRFVRALLELMRLRKWDCELLGKYLGVLENDGLLAVDKLQGNGVNYQVASVYLEELKGTGFPVRQEVIDVILRPFFSVMMRSKDRILLGKVKSCVFDELVKVGKGLLEKKMKGISSKEDEEDVLGVVALTMGLSGRFYDIGSSVDCVQGNRKVVLGLYEEYSKLEKDFELSGIQIMIPEFNSLSGSDGDDDAMVPQLIPISCNTGRANGELRGPDRVDYSLEDGVHSDARISKKSKKAGKEMNGNDKKAKGKNKKKKRKVDTSISESCSWVAEKADVSASSNVEKSNTTAFEEGLSDYFEADEAAVNMDESVIANLQKEFEKIAAEAGFDDDEYSGLCDTPLSTEHGMHARKRRKRSKGGESQGSANSNNAGDAEADASAKSVEKSAKKVRFSMKNNLVWKPHNPLPPESLRLPPSVTPRGSALKKGVPPGPIIEIPPPKEKAKKKKAQKIFRSATPVIKRKKMKTASG